MTIYQIIIVAFVILELSNIVMLYFVPGSRYANAVGVFNAWNKSKEHPEIHEFIRYLVYWIAGSKLIFVLLLIGIVIFGDKEIQQVSLIAISVATLSFYWRLFPLIRKLDKDGEITPKKYSTILGIIILIFLIVFMVGAIV